MYHQLYQPDQPDQTDHPDQPDQNVMRHKDVKVHVFVNNIIHLIHLCHAVDLPLVIELVLVMIMRCLRTFKGPPKKAVQKQVWFGTILIRNLQNQSASIAIKNISYKVLQQQPCVI